MSRSGFSHGRRAVKPDRVFDLGIRSSHSATWSTFAHPVDGLRLYFRCGCRRRAAVFPWVEPEWDVLDGFTDEPMYGYRRVCPEHRALELELARRADANVLPGEA